MYIEQIYTSCLAQGAYYLEHEGQAVIIDPLRDTAPYLKRLEARGARLTYVLETHFHADFVSGHLDLSAQTGAPIVYGPLAQPRFSALIAEHNQVLPLGDHGLRVLHTPGHTMESTCYLLEDPQGQPLALFTGDTLFLGDVGRPDLSQDTSLSREVLAGHLFDSLQAHIKPLPDSVVVYPGHGAGSACGKNLSDQSHDTLGHQKASNYALRITQRDEFIRQVCQGLAPAPYYFPQNARLNQQGYAPLERIKSQGQHPLSPQAFQTVWETEEALVLDTRSVEAYAQGHVPGSVFLGIDGDFAPWVGTLVQDIEQPLLLVAEPERLDEVLTRLARVGYEQVLGYLQGGIPAWQSAGLPLRTVNQVSADEYLAQAPEAPLVDLRKAGEFAAGHLPRGINVPLAYLNERQSEIPKDRTVYLHCAGGYRSLIAWSLLKNRGWQPVNIAGGMAALRQAGARVIETAACAA